MEKVVNPPQSPVNRNRDQLPWTWQPVKKPANSEPAMLMKKVENGSLGDMILPNTVNS
ncbi:hypothetical protein FD08_GL000929 [Lentilactobacillus parakefiri DSM 10551]|nr:hypothetical protein FD08_GL000929 [Lentilactobacillus parakefiri DSM 10551]